MEKLKMHSPNLTQANIEKFMALFPNCVTESRNEKGELKRTVDFDLLRQELSETIVEGPVERYHLNWPGKREALLTANAPIAKTLRPCREESVDFDTTKNLFIEGDNLDALKLLQDNYLGKIKMIYIDPPYNTGNDFIYSDDFAESTDKYLLKSNQTDEEGNRLVSNTESNGRFHSDWLSMMYPRLKLARTLLKEDGVIFISIDDTEVYNLKEVCDQIFGEINYIASMVWEKSRKNDAKLVSVGHEYILIYAKSIQRLKEMKVFWREEKPGAREIWDQYLLLRKKHGKDNKRIEEELSEWFSNLPKKHPSKKWARYKRVDNNGPWRDRDISWPGGDGPTYDVIHPVTGLPCAVPEAGWRYSTPDEMQRQIALGLVEFRDDHTEPPFRKAHIRPVSDEGEISFEDNDDEETGDEELATQVRGSYFYKQSQVSVKYLRALLGAKLFNNPKDHEEIARLINYVTGSDEEGIILDFFGGSGTTAHAVMHVNALTGKRLRYVVVQLPEAVNPKEKTGKAALKLGYETVADIACERLRRSGKKTKEENADKEGIENIDIGFRVLKVDTSNMRDVYYNPDLLEQTQLTFLIDNIKPDRNDEDLLFQILLDWGVELDKPIERQAIDGKTVYFVDGNALVACFDNNQAVTEDFVKKLTERQPLRAVFRDAGFKSDSVKINVEQVFKLMSPVTDVKVI